MPEAAITIFFIFFVSFLLANDPMPFTKNYSAVGLLKSNTTVAPVVLFKQNDSPGVNETTPVPTKFDPWHQPPLVLL